MAISIIPVALFGIILIVLIVLVARASWVAAVLILILVIGGGFYVSTGQPPLPATGPIAVTPAQPVRVPAVVRIGVDDAEIWSRDLEMESASRVAVDGDWVIVTGSEVAVVFEGMTTWSRPYMPPWTQPVFLDKGIILVGTGAGISKGTFDPVSTNTGSWQDGLPQQKVVTTPLVDEGRIYAATEGSDLVALDRDDLTELWRYHVNESPSGELAKVGDHVLFPAGNELHFVRYKGGGCAVEYGFDDRQIRGPVVVEGTTVWCRFVDKEGRSGLGSVNFSSERETVRGNALWLALAKSKEVAASPDSIHRGSRLVVAEEGVTLGVDLAKGEVAWEITHTQEGNAQLAGEGDFLYVAYTGGQLLRVKIQTGEVTGRVALKNMKRPAIAYTPGRIAVVETEGKPHVHVLDDQPLFERSSKE